ncbi:MAG: hypothetical protein MHM6MM_000186 [Cercozoa sp. M6MM]
MESFVSDHLSVSATVEDFSVCTRNVRILGCKSFEKQKGQKGPTRGEVIANDIFQSGNVLDAILEVKPGAVKKLEKALGPKYRLFASSNFFLKSKKHGEVVVLVVKTENLKKVYCMESIWPCSNRRGALCLVLDLRLRGGTKRIAVLATHITHGGNKTATRAARTDDIRSLIKQFLGIVKKHKADGWVSMGDWNVNMNADDNRKTLEKRFKAVSALQATHGGTTLSSTSASATPTERQYDAIFFGGCLNKENIKAKVKLPPTYNAPPSKSRKFKDVDLVNLGDLPSGLTKLLEPDFYHKNTKPPLVAKLLNCSECFKDGYFSFSKLQDAPGIGAKTAEDAYRALCRLGLIVDY